MVNESTGSRNSFIIVLFVTIIEDGLLVKGEKKRFPNFFVECGFVFFYEKNE